MKETTEQLAKKLFQIFDKAKTESIYDNKTRWVALAKEIQRMIIEARIEEAILNYPECLNSRVDILRQQLKELS